MIKFDQRVRLACSLAAILLLTVAVSARTQGAPRAGSCDLPWVFFDLGADSLLHSPVMTDEEEAECVQQARERLRNRRKPDFCPGLKNVKYVDTALDYLRDLKRKGYKLGLIMNVPPEWGQDAQGRYTVRLQFERLKTALVRHDLLGDEQWWIDPEPMHWSVFSDLPNVLGLRGEFLFGEREEFALEKPERVLMSQTRAERKPGRPIFDRAVRLAGGCPTVYQTALTKGAQDERPGARAAGMTTYALGEPGRPYFMPESELRALGRR